MKALSIFVILIAVPLLQGCLTSAVLGTAAIGTKAAIDPRTVGTQINDSTLEMRAKIALSKDEEIKKKARINATVYQGKVLLTGQTPNVELAYRAYQIIKNIKGTTEIFNEVRKSQPIGLNTASADAWITTKVYSQLFGDNRVKSSHVKVMTENGEVFLLGSVTKKEGTAASEIASRVRGVKRVTTAFYYLE